MYSPRHPRNTPGAAWDTCCRWLQDYSDLSEVGYRRTAENLKRKICSRCRWLRRLFKHAKNRRIDLELFANAKLFRPQRGQLQKNCGESETRKSVAAAAGCGDYLSTQKIDELI